MPSNADLIKAASALAEKLQVTVVTDGLTNEKLADLVADLKAKERDAELATQADAAAAAEAAAKPAKKGKEKAKKPPFYVAPGKALTTKKGILSGDTAAEVKAEYLTGGKTALDAFVESGHVLKG